MLEVLDDGATVVDAARRYGVARQTVHGWLRRYAAGGLGGLGDQSSRPAICPHQIPPPVEARVVALRRAHPGWGPPRILTQLRDGVVPLPGRSSVYRALVRCLKRVIARQLYKLLLERYDQPAVEITHAT